MSACNFECLLRFVNKQLDLDKQLEVYEHLDRCSICRDTVCQLSRDLAEVLFIYCVHGMKHYVFRRQIKRAWSMRARVIANALSRRET
jgi:predicted anti-sigma-YlaC factor YlaD